MHLPAKRPGLLRLGLAAAVLLWGTAAIAWPAEASHASGGSADIMSPQLETAIWTIVVFIVLLVVLGRWAWPPLVHALEARQHRIQTDLAEATRARQEAEAIRAEYQLKLAEAQREAQALIEQARHEAARQQDEILARGREETNAMVARAQERIRREADQALAELYARTARLATEVAGRLIRKTLSPSDHEALVREVLEEYARQPGGLN